MCAHAYVRTYVCVCVCVYVCMCAYVCVCVCMCVYVCVCMCVSLHVYMCMCMCTYVYAYVYVSAGQGRAGQGQGQGRGLRGAVQCRAGAEGTAGQPPPQQTKQYPGSSAILLLDVLLLHKIRQQAEATVQAALLHISDVSFRSRAVLAQLKDQLTTAAASKDQASLAVTVSLLGAKSAFVMWRW